MTQEKVKNGSTDSERSSLPPKTPKNNALPEKTVNKLKNKEIFKNAKKHK